MDFLVCFVLTVLLAKSCEGKPAQYNGYPEENRNIINPFFGKLFEGDMLVDSEIKKIALAGGDVSMATSRKRGATKLQTWPNGIIPYVIEPSLVAHRSKIESAMREWENGTCLSFVPFNSRSGNAYLKISSKSFLPGCWARIGYKDVSRYPASRLPFGILLNLDNGCETRRVILHELGHAIGFFHEQSRPDRDKYVEILWQNILPGSKPQFRKYRNNVIDSLGFEYDLKSVMHYGPKMFSVSKDKNTIRPKDPSNTLKLNHDISDIDRQQINALYKCV